MFGPILYAKIEKIRFCCFQHPELTSLTTLSISFLCLLLLCVATQKTVTRPWMIQTLQNNKLEQSGSATLYNRKQRGIGNDGQEARKTDKKSKTETGKCQEWTVSQTREQTRLLQEMSGLELTRRPRVELKLQHDTNQVHNRYAGSDSLVTAHHCDLDLLQVAVKKQQQQKKNNSL